MGTKSTPVDSEVSLTLYKRFQRYNASSKTAGDVYDEHINSPKSVNILDSKRKFYVHSLEGCETVVYNLDNFQRIKVIKHKFDKSNQNLFKETNYFDYKFRSKVDNYNHFQGKPVESCFSHNGKYLWVTYYRRTYDQNAAEPSAVCIIDTDKDEIVRVMPTAPLPKMIACSPDNKMIAITHWGDNTVGLVDVSGTDAQQFKHIKNLVIDKQLAMNFSTSAHVDRDANCGHCLRGTVFTPDSKYLLVGKMASDGIAVINTSTKTYMGTVTGMKNNIRHLVISGDYLYLSINKFGYVQRCNWKDFIKYAETNINTAYKSWKEVSVGTGARTIATNDGKYIFAAVNSQSKIAVVRAADMKVVAEIKADSYPVGMDISADGKYVIVTAQGKSGGGGNSVMVYSVSYK